jgi:polysaccharide chain length determinant protein (PEP-CTERM system associated)
MSSPAVQQVIEQVRGAWRFRWAAMAATWVVCVAGWVAVMAMPDIYAATARVFVDTRTALGPLLQGIAVDADVDSQLDRVKTAILGRPHLERVARETKLDAHAPTPQALSKLIDALREQIKIEGGPAGRDQSGGLYVISYQNQNRDMSIQIVDKLLSSFVEDTLGGKREGSENAQRFLRDQIAEYERRLSESESRLAEFKKKNVGLMPGAQGDYFSRLQNEMDSAKKAEGLLSIAIGRREELHRQLRGEVPYVAGASGGAQAGTMRGASSGGSGDTSNRIQETQARLDELLLRFTDKHPDVLATRETLEQLKARRQSEIEALRRGDPGAAAAVGAASNPVYQSIQLSLNQTEVEIASLRGELGEHQRKVAQLRGMVDTVPGVEAEFASLNRDYDVTKTQYNTLVDRLEKARLTESAAETGSVKFQVVDPPAAGFAPVAPQRARLLVMVLVAGIGVGGGLAYLLHTMRPVFNSARTLAEVTGLTVLGAVSMTWLDRKRGESRVRKLAFGGAAAMLIFVFVCVIAFHNVGVRLIQHVSG